MDCIYFQLSQHFSCSHPPKQNIGVRLLSVGYTSIGQYRMFAAESMFCMPFFLLVLADACFSIVTISFYMRCTSGGTSSPSNVPVEATILQASRPPSLANVPSSVRPVPIQIRIYRKIGRMLRQRKGNVYIHQCTVFNVYL